MKTIYILLFTTLALLVSSCEKKPIDENIEGMWKMTQFTTLADGVVHKECPRIFFSIQLNVVELAERQCTHKYGTFIGHFYYNEDHSAVTMQDFKFRKSTGDDGESVPAERLLPYGINALKTTFKVLKADGKHLVLQSDYATLEFTNF